MCYDYETNLEQIIQDVESQLDTYMESTLMSFYAYQAENVKMQFDMLAHTAATSENPYAAAHVINFRKNYTSVSYLCGKMINDTRDEIIKTFDFQRQELTKTVPHIRTTSEDVHTILTQKQCNETLIEQFYSTLFYTTQMKVTYSISEGYSAYMSQLMNQYAPFMLFSHYISQLQMCIYNYEMGPLSNTTPCLIQVSLKFSELKM